MMIMDVTFLEMVTARKTVKIKFSLGAEFSVYLFGKMPPQVLHKRDMLKHWSKIK